MPVSGRLFLGFCDVTHPILVQTVFIVRRLHVKIDTCIIQDAYQVPGIIAVLAYVTFVDHCEVDSIANLMIKIVADLEYIVPVSCGKLFFLLDNLLHLRYLSIVSKVVGKLLARTLVVVLHLKFLIMISM